MSDFKHGQRVDWQGLEVRIESGPWPGGSVTYGDNGKYLVELLAGTNVGRYRLVSGENLTVPTPKMGDRGSFMLSDFLDVWVWTVQHLDADGVLLWRWDGAKKAWCGIPRDTFDRYWRPEA